MKIFIGNYWVPFPSSEYGGNWTIIAKDEAEAIELLTANYGEFDSEYEYLIPDAVANAESFELAGDHVARVVDTFFT